MAVELKNDQDKLSYTLGMNISLSILQLPLELNKEVVIACVADLLRGGQPQIEQQEYQKIMQDFQKQLQTIAAEQKKKAGEANAEISRKFLEENAKKEGVKVTNSGLQYIVLEEGNGENPKATDTVKVHYEGTLINGQIFDSSIKRGEPVEFPLNHVIPGWTEGLQLMRPGAKYRFFIPSDLAYGEHGASDMIAPNSALIFDVELIEVKG